MAFLSAAGPTGGIQQPRPAEQAIRSRDSRGTRLRETADDAVRRRRSEKQQSLVHLVKSAARSRIEAELQAISGRVKAHELAHMAVLGGAAASGIQYSYAVGPGGARYATGGSIAVDFSPVPGNPEATIRKARQIRRAALAPGDPSSADMRAAAKAYRMEKEAQKELEETRSETDWNGASPDGGNEPSIDISV
jgi:hypothetical protein